MKHFFLDIRYRIEFLLVLCLLALIRILPRCALRPMARAAGACVRAVPSARHIVLENLKAAFPEKDEASRRHLMRESFFHMCWNLLEFFWIGGDPARIRRCYYLPDDITNRLKAHVAAGERIIFVNPHLGSWEASGVMAPFYAGVDMVAIAKPMRNPYLNRLLNSGRRERTAGLEIIFSHGAMRASLKALRQGRGVGTLIDQNTRVRDGGVFVDFFGLPVPSSTAPAALKRYCDAHKLPAVIVYGTSMRLEDGRNTAHSAYLPKPFDTYADDTEVLQELMKISEKFIRMHPEQYLWFYKRFQYIPPDCPEDLRRRYPDYAAAPKASFFRKTLNDVENAS
ncbi:MAG: hypothetical protein IJS01_08260 [Lentisphaeria bacterium]|nr:hypothetical protein [Lentisphaeria bacterium]